MKFLKHVFDFLYFQTWNVGLWHPPDRRFLKDELIPHFMRITEAKPVLFVGVRRYTKTYGRGFGASRFVTIDSDPNLIAFGAEAHFALDVRDLKRIAPLYLEGFGAVFLNGVVGYGLNSSDDCLEALRSIRSCTHENGWLIVGANPAVLENLNFDRLAERDAAFKRCAYLPLNAEVFNFSLPGYSGVHHQYRFFKAQPVAL